MRLVDSHAHLQAEAFDDDADEVLAAARAAGVERLLTPGWDPASSRRGVELARLAGVDGSAGAHPHVAGSVDEAGWEAIARLADDPAVVAIGETGLDYDRAFSSRDAQLAALRRHIRLAAEVGKPLILHCRSRPGERDAQDDLLRELREHGVGGAGWRDRSHGRPTGVLHSFSGPVDYAEQGLEIGLVLSFSGLVFRASEAASAEVARVVPLDRLLVETDAPYLKPRGVRGRRNEPRHVEVTARWLAEQRAEPPEALGEALVRNYDCFVGRT